MKYIPIFLLTLLTSCSASLQDGGWIVPVGTGLAALWTWGRYFFGIASKKSTSQVKGSTTSLVYAIILTLAALSFYYFMQTELL